MDTHSAFYWYPNIDKKQKTVTILHNTIYHCHTGSLEEVEEAARELYKQSGNRTHHTPILKIFKMTAQHEQSIIELSIDAEQHIDNQCEDMNKTANIIYEPGYDSFFFDKGRVAMQLRNQRENRARKRNEKKWGPLSL